MKSAAECVYGNVEEYSAPPGGYYTHMIFLSRKIGI
jgi:hypothetical protein